MTTRTIFLLVFLVIALLIAWLAFQPNQDEVLIPNPASTFCEAQGGRLEICTAADGGQYGVCHLPDGRVCEEWAFFEDGVCTDPAEQ